VEEYSKKEPEWKKIQRREKRGKIKTSGKE
jgi:hypothetical protein